MPPRSLKPLLMVLVATFVVPVNGGPVDVWHWFKRLLDATPIEAHDPPDYSRTLVEALLPEFDEERAAGRTDVGFPELVQVVALADAGRLAEALEVVQAPPATRRQERDVLRLFMRAKLLLSQTEVTPETRDQAIIDLLETGTSETGFQSPRLRFSAVVDAVHAAAVPEAAVGRQYEVIEAYQAARRDMAAAPPGSEAQLLLTAMLWREAFTGLSRLAATWQSAGRPANAVPVAWGVALEPADRAARDAIRAILWPASEASGPALQPASEPALRPLQRAARYELVLLDLAKASAVGAGLVGGQVQPEVADQSRSAAMAQMRRLPKEWQAQILDSGRVSGRN